MLKSMHKKEIDEKMFIYILVSTIALSLVLIVEIIVLKYPLMHLVTWIISIILSVISLVYCNKNKYVLPIRVVYFSLMIFIVLPYGWTLSDVSSPFPLAYAFVMLIAACYLFIGYIRIIFSTAIAIISIIMTILGALYPHMFPFIETRNLVKDAFIQVPITFGAAIFLLTAFANDLRTKNASLEEASTIDYLTGLYNRRYIYEYLSNKQQNAPKDTNIILGVIDANKLKSINDHYGHILGDKVLVSVATHIRSICCSSSTIVSRTGGDEFVVVMEYKREFSVETFTDRFTNTKVRIEEVPNVTISGGFIICSINTPIDIMIAKADKNMYLAKSKELNGIIFTKES